MSNLKLSFRVFNIVFKDRVFYRVTNIIFQCFFFLIFLFFTAAFYNLSYFLDKTSSSVVFYAFLKKNVKPENIKKTIGNWPEVGSVKIITEDEGLGILKKSLGKESSILNTLDSNPLPATLEIGIKSEFAEKDYISQIQDKIKRYDQFEWVDSTERYLGPLLKLKSFIADIFLGGVITLLLLIIFSLRNTTKNFLYKYKHSISLLKLLGASRGFIVFPLVLEGFLETFASSVGSSIIFFYIQKFLTSQLYHLNINVISLPDNIYAVFIASVSLVGALGGLTFKKISEP